MLVLFASAGRIGQAQGSIGRRSLETAGGATDPTMEQGPGAPAPRSVRETASRRWETMSSYVERKGERARCTVKAAQRCVVVTGTHGMVAPSRSCRRGEGFEGQKVASRGSPFRDGVKRGEPQDRQQGATPLQGRGGTTRRGGEKPRGRYAGGKANPPRREARRRVTRATDSPTRTMEGRSLDNPKRAAQPAGWAIRIGTRREGRRQGQEGRVVLCFTRPRTRS